MCIAPEAGVHTSLISVGQASGEVFELNLRYSYEPQQNPLTCRWFGRWGRVRKHGG